ncbi:MAG TPA: hypothetical protein VKA74_20045, partial [Myxococcota bacterium]|nr:hypothetical protein [Myxococcota bacterium]
MDSTTARVLYSLPAHCPHAALAPGGKTAFDPAGAMCSACRCSGAARPGLEGRPAWPTSGRADVHSREDRDSMELLHTAHVPAGAGPFPTILALHGWG